MTQRLRHGLILGVCASVVVISVARDARAWGPRGHRLAARVAESRLSPAAKAEIKAILHDGDTIVSESSWADDAAHRDFPESASWHFVNVPLSAAHYEAQFCRGGGCVVEKIKHYRKVLADRRAPKAERARALLFLVHFIADVHQPLHVGDNHDHGGSRMQVRFNGQSTNLHKVWDSQIIEEHSRDERRWTDDVERLITPERVKEWSQGDVESWADESLQEAKKAYRFPPGSARNAESGVRLGGDYAEAALPVIRLRLAQAGVRLANELNAALGEGGNR
jgi:nuclease S1